MSQSNLNNFSFDKYERLGVCHYDGDQDFICREKIRETYHTEVSTMVLKFRDDDHIPGIKSADVLSEILGGIPYCVHSSVASLFTFDKLGIAEVYENFVQESSEPNFPGHAIDEVVEDCQMRGTNEPIDYNNTYLYFDDEHGLAIQYGMGWRLCIYYSYTKEREEYAKSVLRQFRDKVLKPHKEKTLMWLVSYANSHYYLEPLEIRPHENFDIKKLYNDDFAPVDVNIRKFVESDTSGLVILHGDPGSGKTSYIRQLAKMKTVKFVYLPCQVVEQLNSPDFSSFFRQELKNSILVIEDCEQLLTSRDTRGSSPGIVNILNIADGIFADTLNIKIICTFNADIDSIGIDPALLRKGRLVQKYEFKKLSKDKTIALLKETGKPLDDEQGELVLSDIFYKETTNGGENGNGSEIVEYI